MAKYVMSDIHGDYDKFKKMMKKINFNTEKDKLYVLGDAIDRGPDGLKIIEEIRNSENGSIEMLLGNHEHMMLLFYTKEDHEFDWHNNGGLSTHEKFIEQSDQYKADLLKYLKDLELYKVIDNFVLVHGGFYIPGYECTLDEAISNSSKEDFLMDREFFISNKKISDHTIISGHTSTISLGKKRIIHKEGKILIDCGCGLKNGRLACLRLEDLKEYYV